MTPEVSALQADMRNVTTALVKLVDTVEKAQVEGRKLQTEMHDELIRQGKDIEHHTASLEDDKKKIDSIQIKVDNLEALKNRVYGWAVACGLMGGSVVVAIVKTLGAFAK